jgi:DNA-binding transcriptional ArsR family regulator
MLQYHSDPIDRVFHALADPGRRRMVERLTAGPASLSELAAPLTMSLSAVGQHLKVLEQAGLVDSEKVGRTRRCQLRPDEFRLAERWFTDRRAMWDRDLDRLGEFLDVRSAPTETESR